MVTVYKICHRREERFYSGFVRKELAVEYVPHTKVYPQIPGTPLMAFNSLKAARVYLEGETCESFRPIFRATAEIMEGINPRVIFYANSAYDYRDVLTSFWAGNISRSFRWAEMQEPPPGTVYCKWIRLEEEVESPNF